MKVFAFLEGVLVRATGPLNMGGAFDVLFISTLSNGRLLWDCLGQKSFAVLGECQRLALSDKNIELTANAEGNCYLYRKLCHIYWYRFDSYNGMKFYSSFDRWTCEGLT